MRTISIITPCSRPENLLKIKEDMMKYTDRVKILWFIVYDASLGTENIPFIQDEKYLYVVQLVSPYKNSIGGHLHRNYAISNMKRLDGQKWVYFLDDDNLLHPSFVNFFEEDPLDNEIYFFSQERNGRKVICSPNTMKIGNIDTAQILCKLSHLFYYRFNDVYDADGLFIMNMWDKFKSSFYFESHNFVYYNKLKDVAN